MYISSPGNIDVVCRRETGAGWKCHGTAGKVIFLLCDFLGRRWRRFFKMYNWTIPIAMEIVSSWKSMMRRSRITRIQRKTGGNQWFYWWIYQLDAQRWISECDTCSIFWYVTEFFMNASQKAVLNQIPCLQWSKQGGRGNARRRGRDRGRRGLFKTRKHYLCYHVQPLLKE